jgi:hypothetical protein
MAIVWKKQKSHQNVSNDIMDRFIDGRVIDQIEMHDRIIVLQQLGVVFSMPQRRNYKNQL